MSKMIHVIAPAPKHADRVGAVIDQGSWESEFLGRATKRDETGFPTEGSFGLSFAVTYDLSKAPKSTLKKDAVSAIQIRARTKGIVKTEKQATADARQLISAFESLKKGDLIAFKKGTLVIAIVELTSDYHFCEEQPWGWHSWDYRLLKKVSLAEQPKNRGGLLKTFHPNYLPLPSNLRPSEVKTRPLSKALFLPKAQSLPKAHSLPSFSDAWAWA